MSTLSLRLPDSLHQKLRELAARDDVSINQLIATAVAEKTSALLTLEYLEARGSRADRRLLDRILARVPDSPPIPGDELPDDVRQPPKATHSTRRAGRMAQSRRRARAARG